MVKKTRSFRGAKAKRKSLSGFTKFIKDIEDTVGGPVSRVYQDGKSAVSRVYQDGYSLTKKFADTSSKVSTDLSGGISRGVEDIGKNSGLIIPALAGIAALFFLNKG